MIVHIYIDDLIIYNLIFNFAVLDIVFYLLGIRIKYNIKFVVILIGITLISVIFSLIEIIYGKSSCGIKGIVPIFFCFLLSLLIDKKVDYKKSFLTILFSYFFIGGIFNYVYYETGLLTRLDYHLNKVIAYPNLRHIVIVTMIIFSVWGARRIARVIITYVIAKRNNDNIVTVKIENGEYLIHVNALIDTGNNLYEPITGKPVSIIEAKSLGQMRNMKVEKLFCVPYKSVGVIQNTLYAIMVDRITIYYSSKKRTFDNVLVGIYKGELTSKNNYKMILNNVYGKVI